MFSLAYTQLNFRQISWKDHLRGSGIMKALFLSKLKKYLYS